MDNDKTQNAGVATDSAPAAGSECDRCIGCPHDDLDYYATCKNAGYAYFIPNDKVTGEKGNNDET